jgi:hypothetical protein
MSIPVLIQVYDEMRRLAIAGSAVAPGDFRLKKLVPLLEKSGEKAPVFAKVGQAAQALVDSNEKTAATALLDLATLVNAILYTQGETGIAGELKPLESVDFAPHATQASARILKPLLTALSTTGSGRLELIRDAQESGTFKDIRLVKPALNALDDPHPEIAHLIAEKVLPSYGKAILPELRAKLDVKGRGGNLHRLRLLHQLDQEGSRDLVQLALAEGSKEMKVAAIECLGTFGEDCIYLLDQAKAKAKDVRSAALRALLSARASTSQMLAALKKAIVGDDLELIVPAVKQCTLPEVRNDVLEQAEKQFNHTLACKDKTQQGSAVARMRQLVMCLDPRTDAQAETLLLKCFENARALAAIKSEPSGSDLNELVAHVLAQGTPKMRQKLAAMYKALNGNMLASSLLAARSIMTSADFYKEFRPMLADLPAKSTKKPSAEFARGEMLARVLTSDDDQSYHQRWGVLRAGRGPASARLPDLDPRWLDAAVEANSLDLVCQLARPGHTAANDFLFATLAKLEDKHEAQRVLQVMVRIQHPMATDAIIDTLKAQAKETTHYYFGYWYSRMIPQLPRTALPRLEELLKTLPEKMVDHLLDAVLELKTKTE